MAKRGCRRKGVSGRRYIRLPKRIDREVRRLGGMGG
jgi:hypothetical protein